MAQSSLRPVAESARIDAIDAVRGLALLGIFLVNIQTFGEAFGSFIIPSPPEGTPTGELAAFYFVKIFCESKTYPLFSLLFGIGLALQWQRARAVGREFLGTGLRRLLVLGVLGLAHALLLWYGDILFLYSVAGVLLLLMSKARPRTLAVVASVLLGVSVVLMAGMAGLMTLAEAGKDSAQTPAAAEVLAGDPGDLQDVVGTPPEEIGVTATPVPAPTDAESVPAVPTEPLPSANDAAATSSDDAGSSPTDPFGRLMRAMRDGQTAAGPASPIWIETETEAYRSGPFDQIFKFRAMTYAFFLVIALFGFWWHVGAMFLFGAALLKAGLFTPERRHWHRRFVLLGAFVGLPASVLVAFLPRLVPEGAAMLLGTPLLLLCGPLLSLGYLGAVTLLVTSGRARAVTGALAQVGRMALTNYLTQTVVATTIFYYYGLGLFGETTRVERIGMVLGIYLCQVAFSVAWLRFFRFGPMEWLWRSLTYLRPQPMRRGGSVEPGIARRNDAQH